MLFNTARVSPLITTLKKYFGKDLRMKSYKFSFILLKHIVVFKRHDVISKLFSINRMIRKTKPIVKTTEFIRI